MDKTTLAALRQLNAETAKTYGEAFTRRDYIRPYEAIPTGIDFLDYQTGIGGLALGRVALYWGPEGAGKSTAALAAMARAQQKFPDRAVGYIDMEQTFDGTWATALGLDLDPLRFFHIYPDSSEDVADVLKKWVSTGLFSIIVVDSIGGMIAKVEMEKKAEESAMGKNAQAVTRMTRMSAPLARKYNTSVLLISQVRVAMGGKISFDTYAGPKAVRHVQSQRVKFSRTGTPPISRKEGDDKVTIGVEIKAKIERSKVAAVDGKTATFTIISQETEKFGPAGIDRADQTVQLIDGLGLMEKSGSHYEVAKGVKINGQPALKKWLLANPGVMDELRERAIRSQESLIIPDERTEITPQFPEASGE